MEKAMPCESEQYAALVQDIAIMSKAVVTVQTEDKHTSLKVNI